MFHFRMIRLCLFHQFSLLSQQEQAVINLSFASWQVHSAEVFLLEMEFKCAAVIAVMNIIVKLK